MKNSKYVWAGLIVISLFLGACSSNRPRTEVNNQPIATVLRNSFAPTLTNVSVVVSAISNSNQLTTQKAIDSGEPFLTNATRVYFTPVVTNVITATNLADKAKAYEQGLLSKDEIMQAMILEQNKKTQDFYGKVIDQYKQPVSGVAVTGNLMFEVGFDSPERQEVFTTQTGADGLFQFVGLHGARLGVTVAMEGYEMGSRGEGYKGPSGAKTTPNDRAIFTMWKLKGPEPMTHARLHAYIPCDGSVTRYDLLTGKPNANGDLIVKLRRHPLDIVRGKPFDWSATVEIVGGGLQPIADLYPNEAPVEGYQSEVALNFPANMPGWMMSINRPFYFKIRNGQMYGRMNIRIMANFQPPPTLFDAEIYANPAGSRNLEFEPQKQIR